MLDYSVRRSTPTASLEVRVPLPVIIIVVLFCALLAALIIGSLTARNDRDAGVWLEHYEVPADYMTQPVNVKLEGVNRRNGPRNQPAAA